MREATTQAVGSLDCPRLMEMKMCIRGDNCMEYSWELSSWTSCLVNNGLDNCGVLGPVTEPLVFSCEVPCDVDCLLSDWSPWSSCSKTCGLGKFNHVMSVFCFLIGHPSQRKRDRFIVQQFLGNGRPCPTSLMQTKPCFNQGCYSWNVSDWSPCATQGGG
ncbi:hypothetical protein KUTeg_015446 [Tegillarca granosa]|uniref:Spondin-like TSP1 domain-containing protein n=1 Tax=Tegillarca granosa TaxID=220873 RepID=A0ABQ9EUU8_TEGGR|nr:hypothetical protein KUTeg_015446 [Tegillarca granosa]